VSAWEPPASATLHRVCPACAVSCGKTSVLDHLPESIAGAAVFDPIVRLGAPGTCDPPQSVSSVHGVLWENSWVWQLVFPMKSNSDVIRWSMKDGARIREAGTIYGADIRHPSCLYSDARVRSDQCRLSTLFS
jgi:hypothetical protein